MYVYDEPASKEPDRPLVRVEFNSTGCCISTEGRPRVHALVEQRGRTDGCSASRYAEVDTQIDVVLKMSRRWRSRLPCSRPAAIMFACDLPRCFLPHTSWSSKPLFAVGVPRRGSLKCIATVTLLSCFRHFPRVFVAVLSRASTPANKEAIESLDFLLPESVKVGNWRNPSLKHGKRAFSALGAFTVSRSTSLTTVQSI